MRDKEQKECGQVVSPVGTPGTSHLGMKAVLGCVGLPSRPQESWDSCSYHPPPHSGRSTPRPLPVLTKTSHCSCYKPGDPQPPSFQVTWSTEKSHLRQRQGPFFLASSPVVPGPAGEVSRHQTTLGPSFSKSLIVPRGPGPQPGRSGTTEPPSPPPRGTTEPPSPLPAGPCRCC